MQIYNVNITELLQLLHNFATAEIITIFNSFNLTELICVAPVLQYIGLIINVLSISAA